MLDKLQSPWLTPGETLLCLGDSLTAADPGYMQLLNAKLTARNIKVINAGLGGDKTPAALARLNSVLDNCQPDAVSIFLGTNDAAIGRAIWADEPIVAPETYRDNLCWIVHLIKMRCHVQKFSIATPLYKLEGEAYTMHGDILKNYAAMAREAADRMHTLLIPMDVVSEAFYLQNLHRMDWQSGLLMTTDGTHPTPEVYELLADAFLKYWKMDLN